MRSAVRLPLSGWPADTAADALWLAPGGALVGGPDGVRAVGAPHPAAGDLVVAAPRDVVAFVALGDHVWAVGQRAVSLDQKGRLDHLLLPERPTDAVAYAEALWITSDTGLWRQEPDGVRLVARLPGAVRAAASPEGLWVAARGVVHRVVGPVSRPYLRTHTALDVAAAPGGAWVGTEDGLERLVLGGDDPGEALDVLGELDGGVAIPAVAPDGAGGVWFAGGDGSVGRVLADGRAAVLHLPGEDPAPPNRVVADQDYAWVLTDDGTWRVWLPADAARPVELD